MNSDRWNRVNEVFLAVANLPAEDRPAHLDAACDDDHELRSEVERLLASDVGLNTGFLAPVSSLEQPSAAADGRSDPFVGRRVGSYEIQAKLGEGGMGNVYLGVRTADFATKVAIKLIRRGMDSEAILQRFQDEMQFQAALGKHPHIAQMIDAGETEDGSPYFVMEYVDGERIDRWCDHQRLSINSRLALFQEVCKAVQFAHQNTVIHRDLKPSNILVTSDGRPKLIDFGIAKLLGDAPELPVADRTLTGMQVLTPEYASPEQIRGERLTTATDVYSLGVVLYELLTGRKPYRTTTLNPLEMLQVVTESKPQRPSDVVLQTETIEDHQGTTSTIVPEEIAQARDIAPGRLSRTLRGDLDRVVLMALRNEPERRYSSAEQLAEDVRRYLDGLPVRAQRDTWAYRARKFSKRNWAALGAAALVILSIAAGGAFSFTQWNRAEAEAARSQQAAVDESLAREVAQTAQAQAETEAAKAEATVDFLLNDLIQAAHPSQEGYQVTVLEAVESSLDKIGQRFGDQPQIEAAVRFTAAHMLYDLGQVDAGGSEFETAYELLRAELGPDHKDTIEAQLGLATVSGYFNSSEEATSIIRDVFNRSRRVLGDEHETTVTAMVVLGGQLQSAGRYEEAIPLLLRSIELHDRVYAPDDLRRTWAKSDLVACYKAQGNLDAAVSTARELIEFAEAHSEGRDTDYLGTLNTLASILYGQRRFDEALPYLETLVEEMDDILPLDDVRRAMSRGLYGRCLWGLRRMEEAEPHILYQYEQMRRIRGADDWLTERSLASLRKFLYDCGKYDLAVEYHLESLRTRLRIGGRDQGESVLSAFAEFTEASKKHDRYPGDNVLYDALTEYGMKELPADHKHRAQFLGNLGWALLQKAEYTRAEPLLLASYEERKVSQGMDHGDVHWLLSTLVDLFRETDRPDTASEYETQLLSARGLSSDKGTDLP